MSNKPVVIEFKRDQDGYGKGERFVVKSAEAAQQLYPGATVVSYEDGAPIETPKSSAPAAAPAAKATEPAKSEAKVANP